MPLIGNPSKLAFDLIPVFPSWERRYAPERAAWAGTAIWVGGQNLCRHEVAGSDEIGEHFFIPLAPIAEWLMNALAALEFDECPAPFSDSSNLHEIARLWGDSPPPSGLDEDEWLEARQEWWRRHFLHAGADGARVPNLAFSRADKQLALSWAPPHFFSEDAPRSLAPAGEFSLPWSEGLRVLDEFVTQVAVWLWEADAEDAPKTIPHHASSGLDAL